MRQFKLIGVYDDHLNRIMVGLDQDDEGDILDVMEESYQYPN